MTAVVIAVCLAACGGDGSPGGSASPQPTPSPTPTPVACAAGPPISGTPDLTKVRVASGLEEPVDLQVVPGDTHRLFVVEKGGRIRILRDGALVSAPFFDIRSRVSTRLEQGLLGLAFHPRYAENGRFFIHFTDKGNLGHIAEVRVSPTNPDLADPASERDLLVDEVPHFRHNAGGLVFGPDGMLYIGLGDGSQGGDPEGNAQNLATTFGKILRVDVNSGTTYSIPADNPFFTTPGARREIWAYGLRNPWRFSFDRVTGDMLIGDVGQGHLEEIDLGLAAEKGGENYGWNIFEGTSCYLTASGCSTAGLTPPILEYTHREGCAVIAGPVYRGCRMPGYSGLFFYSDYCSGQVESFRVQNAQAVERRDWTPSLGRSLDLVTSFGVDNDGEMYILDSDGEIFKIVPEG